MDPAAFSAADVLHVGEAAFDDSAGIRRPSAWATFFPRRL